MFNSAFIFIVFSGLVAATHQELFTRSREDWHLDLIGLCFQGVAVPVLQTFGVALALKWMFPTLAGTIDLPTWIAFALGFVGVDFVYYFNHRLLHSDLFWPIHRIHHTSEKLDVISTSRNSIWAPFFIVYLWLGGIAVWLLQNPTGFLAALALTSALDLWRHTKIRFGHRIFSKCLITPHEHLWHHSSDRLKTNFGANLNLWDKLFGTYESPCDVPTLIGTPLSTPKRTWFLYPWNIT